MLADELIAAISALEDVRRVATSGPVRASLLVAGIEVASTGETTENGLRRLWRERQRGGAAPLLLVADEGSSPGSLLALGVADGGGPVRLVEGAALAGVLRRLSKQNRLEAVRELAAELERLDKAGTPGLKVRGLLTLHTLDSRLRRNPTRWGPAEEAVAKIPKSADWRGVLTGLGYQLERRALRGYHLRHEHRPVAVVHPKESEENLPWTFPGRASWRMVGFQSRNKRS
jgi:hypothetical protein